MPRKGRRHTVAKGIYRDSGGFEVRIVIGGVPYSTRLPLDSTIAELKRARAQLEAQGRTATPRQLRGTLRSDAVAYLRLVKHLASWDDREDHLNAWIVEYGDVFRHRLTDADVLAARVKWLAKGRAPKTINHRVDTLRNLYHRLGDRRAWTPCDDIAPLPVPKTPIQRVPDQTILDIDAELQRRERSGMLKDARTRARFRVLVSTGKRPCEVMRAQSGDVNLTARVWVPRDAKGGYCPGVYLNADMFSAWTLFVESGAWGPFNHGAFARTLRAAGWPADVRIYQARHSTWIAASERGIDLHDIAIGAGHTDPRLTRRMYVPVLNSRLQRLSEALDGRFNGFPVVPDSDPDPNSQTGR